MLTKQHKVLTNLPILLAVTSTRGGGGGSLARKQNIVTKPTWHRHICGRFIVKVYELPGGDIAYIGEILPIK